MNTELVWTGTEHKPLAECGVKDLRAAAAHAREQAQRCEAHADQMDALWQDIGRLHAENVAAGAVDPDDAD